jgi:hypothetical protein
MERESQVIMHGLVKRLKKLVKKFRNHLIYLFPM